MQFFILFDLKSIYLKGVADILRKISNKDADHLSDLRVNIFWFIVIPKMTESCQNVLKNTTKLEQFNIFPVVYIKFSVGQRAYKKESD